MRLPDWATRLDKYIAENADRPFSYNCAEGLDCCTFTFGAIYAMTGIVVGLQFAGAYATKRESLLLMHSYVGRPSLYASISKLMQEHGFMSCAAFLAQRGDVVLCPQGRESFLGVLDLNGRDVLSVGEHGTRRVPLNIKCRAWRI